MKDTVWEDVISMEGAKWNIFWGVIPKRIQIFFLRGSSFKRQAHCSFIQNSQKLEAFQMSLNWRINKDNVVHLHSVILLRCLKKTSEKFKQMDATRKESWVR